MNGIKINDKTKLNNISNWDAIFESLQLHEILEKDMPRLLYECLLDRKKWQERTLNLQREIMTNNARLQQIINEMQLER